MWSSGITVVQGRTCGGSRSLRRDPDDHAAAVALIEIEGPARL